MFCGMDDDFRPLPLIPLSPPGHLMVTVVVDNYPFDRSEWMLRNGSLRRLRDVLLDMLLLRECDR